MDFEYNHLDHDKVKKLQEAIMAQDTRRIKLEDINKEDYIPFLGGRPKRDTYITKDDVTNLVIELNNTKDVKELYE